MEGTLRMVNWDDSEGGPLPAYTASLMNKTTKLSWNARARPAATRTKLQLDSNVAETLAQQWLEQQPAARRSRDRKTVVRADATMDWNGKLTPGLNGVRLLVVTLFCWGLNIANCERTQWEHLALDFADVLDILTEQAGAYVEVEINERIGRDR